MTIPDFVLSPEFTQAVRQALGIDTHSVTIQKWSDHPFKKDSTYGTNPHYLDPNDGDTST